MKGKRYLLVATALVITFLMTSSPSILPTQAGSSRGSVQTVGVGAYWNRVCTKRVSTIDWGVVSLGSTKKVTIYVRNEGNTVITLKLVPENWNPSDAPKYVSVSWSYLGQTIKPSKVIGVTLSLTVLSNASGINSFAFGTTIYGVY